MVDSPQILMLMVLLYIIMWLWLDKKQWGGVYVYIRKNGVTELKKLNVVEDYLESVFVKILHNGNLIVVGAVYLPPNSNAIDFNDAMINIFEKTVHLHCYNMGDYNLDLMKHDKHPPTEKFIDLMYANSFIPIINRPQE